MYLVPRFQCTSCKFPWHDVPEYESGKPRLPWLLVLRGIHTRRLLRGPLLHALLQPESWQVSIFEWVRDGAVAAAAGPGP
mmetsp:Transcript_61339/g.174244  ORF Transcript_61339/g.174244 Transcript_61339/m.174244 type:complete len:80 (-) Transcript_61339:173-412(-)